MIDEQLRLISLSCHINYPPFLLYILSSFSFYNCVYEAERYTAFLGVWGVCSKFRQGGKVAEEDILLSRINRPKKKGKKKKTAEINVKLSKLRYIDDTFLEICNKLCAAPAGVPIQAAARQQQQQHQQHRPRTKRKPLTKTKTIDTI